MTKHVKELGCLALVCAVAVACPAQKKQAAPAAPAQAVPSAPSPADKVKVDKIVYSGTGAADYSQSDFAAATELAPGLIAQGDIQKAADLLDGSGQFGSVSYGMDGSTLVYIIVAAPKVLPVHFENFAWWSEIDLLREVHARCPLFLGTLAGTGGLQQHVLETLTTLVTAKVGVPAKIDFTVLARPGEPPHAVAYSISRPVITIGSVALSNESLDMSSAVAEVERRLEGKPYNRDADKELLTSKLGEAYAANGYIDMAIKGFEATDPKPAGSGYSVTVIGKLNAGAQYHIASVNWTDTPQMNQAAFNTANTMKAGDVASRVALDNTLHNIERAYQLQGYVNAKAMATPTLDHEHATVTYDISVVPGTAFHTD